MATLKEAVIDLADQNGFFFTNASTDDVLVRATDPTQSIHLGSASNGLSTLHIASNNVQVHAELTVHGNILPGSNLTYDIGSATQRIRDIYLSDSTIYLGTASISSCNDDLRLSGGIRVGNSRVIDSSGKVVSDILETGSNARDWVLARVANAELGAVGTFAFLTCKVLGLNAEGTTRPGSELQYGGTYLAGTADVNNSGGIANVGGGASPGGTWQIYGRSGVATRTGPGLWLRII